MKKTTTGFTIVELLIVIVVIAILAAISVVAYNGVQSRARISAHAHAAAQAEKEIMTYALQQNSESVSLSNTLVGFKEGQGDIELLKPLMGMPDITMYAVYEVLNTSGYYNTVAILTPSIDDNRFRLQTGADGSSSFGYRIDTSEQANLASSMSGVRVPGNKVIGWLQSNSNATGRAFSYNQSAASQSTSIAPHLGWTFTGLTLLNSNDGIPIAAYVFNVAHDQATREQVIRWLSQKYGVGL